MSARLLLTGSGGLIGRHLRPGGWELARADVDLLEPGAAAELIARVRPTHLLHFAWVTEPGAFWGSPQNSDWVRATLELLRAFGEAGGARAVCAGSCAEYDWTGAGPCSERTTPLRPSTLYGQSKHAARVEGERICAELGVSMAWGRIFFLHGPGEDPRRLLPSLAQPLLAGRPAPMSHGRQVRDFLHARDVAGAFLALLESGAEGPINIASGEPRTIADFGREVARCAGRPELLRIGALPERDGEPPELVADTARLRDEVGWAPRLDFAAGIADSVSSWRT